MKTQQHEAHPGDLIVVPAAHVGEQRRRGRIVDILGTPEHARYRVRWDDGHETVLTPDAGTTISRVPEDTA